MGSNNNNQPGNPRDRQQQTINQQTERFNQQQGPMVNAMAQNYGRATEANYGDYTDVMNQYRNIASGSDAADYTGDGGGGGGGGGYSAFTVNPERVGVERAGVNLAGVERASSRSLGPLERVQAQKLNPLERVKASDPFASYGGYQEFSQTGGYSPQDVANMRARGVAPIRAAYADAQRGIGQQRSLQGGYSPNAVAARVKMAREQGQGMADATQNVEAGIAQARNQGRLAGFGGMRDIEQARLGAQMQGDIFNAQQAMQGNQFDIGNQMQGDIYNAGQAFQGQQFDIGNEMNTSQFNAGQGNQVGMFNAGQGNEVGMFNAGQGNQMGQFNADLNYRGQVYNADAQARAQAANNAASSSAANSRAMANAQNMDDRFRALSGMTSMYGTTPGMSNMFGNQLLTGVNMGGQFGTGMANAGFQSNQLPGQYEQTMGRVQQGMNMAGQAAGAIYPWLNDERNTGGGYAQGQVDDVERRIYPQGRG